jgi:hypothetical protein
MQLLLLLLLLLRFEDSDNTYNIRSGGGGSFVAVPSGTEKLFCFEEVCRGCVRGCM